jgi:hypothetical protein
MNWRWLWKEIRKQCLKDFRFWFKTFLFSRESNKLQVVQGVARVVP